MAVVESDEIRSKNNRKKQSFTASLWPPKAPYAKNAILSIENSKNIIIQGRPNATIDGQGFNWFEK